MAEDTFLLLGARYDSEYDAIADYEELKESIKEFALVDEYDAAVVSRRGDGKVKIIKRHESPTRHSAREGLGIGLAGGVALALFPAVAIGGALLAGVAGAAAGAAAGHVAAGMSRHDLKELGELLDEGESGLLVIASTDMEARIEEELKRASKVQKKRLRADQKAFEAAIDEAQES